MPGRGLQKSRPCRYTRAHLCRPYCRPAWYVLHLVMVHQDKHSIEGMEPPGMATSFFLVHSSVACVRPGWYSCRQRCALTLCMQVTLAPVSLVITPSALVPVLSFTKRFLRALEVSRAGSSSGKIQMLSSAAKRSLRASVIDSYIRNRVVVPMSLSSFLPKMQLSCPQVGWPVSTAVMLDSSGPPFSMLCAPVPDPCVQQGLSVMCMHVCAGHHSPPHVTTPLASFPALTPQHWGM